MLFSDDGGRLSYYWGCSPAGGIWVVELDANNPPKTIGSAAQVIFVKPDAHPWVRVGGRKRYA